MSKVSIEITDEDFGFLYHESYKIIQDKRLSKYDRIERLADHIDRLDYHFGSRFTLGDIEDLKHLNQDLYAYCIDGHDNNLQALVTYKLLSKKYESGLFWDQTLKNDKFNEAYGWVVISTRPNDSEMKV